MTRKLTLSLGLLVAMVLGFGSLQSVNAMTEEAGPADAPDFTLKDHHGNEVTLSEIPDDQIVVLEWINFQCPFVVRHHNDQFETMVTLANAYKDQNVKWLAINSSHFATIESNKADVQANDLPYPILNDSSGEVGQAYDAKTTPHMFIIKDGKILYDGAIDNDKSGNMSAVERVNYVKQALDEILAGQTVSTPKTKPYGCSVKYKK